MVAMKKSLITDTKFATMRTDLGSVCRRDSQKAMPVADSLIFNELPELQSAPITNHAIEFPSPVPSSDSCQILHNKEGSGFSAAYNLFAYYMVHITSKPFLPAFQPFQVPTGRFCAFTLQSCFQILKSSEMLLNIAEEKPVAGYSETVYTEVNTDQSFDRAEVDVSLFGNTKMKIQAAIAQEQLAFSHLPVSIFREIRRDSYWQFDSAFDSAEAQNIIFEGETSRQIISDAAIEEGLGFCLLAAFNSTLDGGSDKLGLQLRKFSPHLTIDSIIQFQVRTISSPANINGIIDSITIDRKCLSDNCIINQFDFDDSTVFHNY